MVVSLKASTSEVWVTNNDVSSSATHVTYEWKGTLGA